MTTTAVTVNPRLTDNIVRIGVNYKFDQSGAMFAKF